MKKLTLPLVVFLIVAPHLRLNAQTLFSNQNAFIWIINLNGGNVDHYFSEYIFRFDNKNHNAYYEDEFEMAKSIQELKEEVKKTSVDQEYYITYTSTFGRYSFETNEFGFEPFPEGKSIELFNFVFNQRIATNTNADLVFSNGAEITSLPMEFDNANFLVKMRKDKRSGKVDRTVYLKIYFNVKDYFEYEDLSDSKQKVTLFANITKIEAYENDAFLTDPLASISTEYLLTKLQAEKEKKKKKDEANAEVKTVNDLNEFLSDHKVDKELKAKLMKTAVEHYNE